MLQNTLTKFLTMIVYNRNWTISLYCAVLGLISLSTNPLKAATLTPENILVSSKDANTITEYTPSGSIVQTFAVSHPSNEQVRDLTVDNQGQIHVYNGTFDPILSTIDPETGTVTDTTFSGWSTVNNGTYGGITSFNDKIFVTDMETSGDNGADEAQGIVVFEGGNASRFATDIEPIDLNLGLDGLLYALEPGGSPGGRMVHIYDPTTLAKIREIDLTPNSSTGFTSDRRAIAVNDVGELFVATWSGTVFHLDATGNFLNSTDISCGNFNCSLVDIDINSDGTILLTERFGDVLMTNENFAPPTLIDESTGFDGRFVAFANNDLTVEEPVVEEQSVPESSSILGLFALSLLPLTNSIKQRIQ